MWMTQPTTEEFVEEPRRRSRRIMGSTAAPLREDVSSANRWPAGLAVCYGSRSLVSVRKRIVHIGVVIAAVLLSITLARTGAFAASDRESCSTNDANVDHKSPDGTEAICQATAPGKATAHASDQALAGSSTCGDRSEAKSSASGVGAAAVAGSCDGGTATASASGENTQAVSGAATGTSKATAKGKDSQADAEIESTGEGKANATAADGGQATALITVGVGDAVARANGASQALALVSTGGGKATSVSSGNASSATADVVNGGVAKAIASEGAQAGAAAGPIPPGHRLSDKSTVKCRATASGSGVGGNAEAACQKTGSVVTAVATKGSVAIGSDTAPPTCMPMNGGIAKVTSPMGNCQ